MYPPGFAALRICRKYCNNQRTEIVINLRNRMLSMLVFVSKHFDTSNF